MKKIYNNFISILKDLRLNFIVRLLNDTRHLYWYIRFLKFFKEARMNINSTNIKNSETIWIFWWQGIDQMPKIVKSCYDSVLRHANNHKVILVTKNNFKNYTDIEDRILDYVNDNKISLTAFSDVLRFNLLKNNGGLWMDATIFVRDDLKDSYFTDMFTVGIDDGKYHESVNGGYSCFLFGGCNNDVINFMDSFHRVYFKYNDHIKYYFTIDEALNYCYKNNIGSFKKYVNEVSFSSDIKLHSMQKVLNDLYSEDTFKKVTNRFSKLTYKMDFKDGKDTFYKKIVFQDNPFN